ncbi:MarR family winged helix-turn-helix transcriptional regulator [Actinokineospora guangxiensis]|uniref:MarR family winged helix-turn-helix transcriptional regulator n=1 Tax=Actinokineospora guangxiensis TaxID=1490288 RepID=A0ABW0ER25_9PSEU
MAAEVPGPDEVAEIEGSALALGLVLTRANTAVYPKVPALQLRALHFIETTGPLTLTRLAAMLRVLPSSATRLCDRLQANGLLDRRPGATDRREVDLILTDKGRDLLERLRRDRRADVGRVLARMSPDGRAALLSGLREFTAAADSALLV